MWRKLVVLVSILLIGSAVVLGDDLDPPLFTGNAALCPASTCSPLGTGSLVGEGIGIASNSLTIYDQGKASSTIQSPILLIIAVPNAPAGYQPPQTITSVTTTGTGSWSGILGGTDVYGGSWNTVTGSAGTFGSSSSGSIYGQAGIANDGGGSSENYSNLSGLDNQLHYTSGAPTFDVFVYTLTGTVTSPGPPPTTSPADLAQTQYLTVDLSGNLTLGTYAVAYGCQSGDLTSADCSGGGVYSTPFTHAGDVTDEAAEPGSLALSAIMLAGFFGLGLRKKLSIAS